MSYIICKVFRKSGKYYTDEKVFIKNNTPDSNIPGAVYDNRNIEDMIYVGKTIKYEVPFLVPAV
jgi:hypothetical protein